MRTSVGNLRAPRLLLYQGWEFSLVDIVVEGQKTGRASGRVLDEAYLWINRVLWPIVSATSGFTTYWTFELPQPGLLVQAGGCVFGVVAAICALISLFWWNGDGRLPPP